jgi:hypothetical protein
MKYSHIIIAFSFIFIMHDAALSQPSILKEGDLSDNKILHGGGKLYHVQNDSERILLLKRPGVSIMDTLDIEDANTPEYWSATLEHDFNRYAVFGAACGSNYCRIASVLDKESGKIVWSHDDYFGIVSHRPEGEVIYSKGYGKDNYMELRIYDVASAKTERYTLPKDMKDCPAPSYCIDAVKAEEKIIKLTYRPGEDAKSKTISIKRKAGKIIKEE